MPERTYGFEIESELKHDAPLSTAYPTVDAKKRGDTLLSTGILLAHPNTPVAYKALYNRSLAHFEVVVDPFKDITNLQPLISDAYDIAANLPTLYLPWNLVEVLHDKERGYFTKERPADTSEISVNIQSIDVSCSVRLEELGVDEKSLPRAFRNDATDQQVRLKKLRYSNSDLQFILENPTGQVKQLYPQLRRINGVYVLHTGFEMSTLSVSPQKNETVRGVVTHMQDITQALEAGTNRSFAIAIALK